MRLPLNTVFATNDNSQKGMLTYYNLEAEYLAINAERTQYMMLDQGQRDTCKLSFPGLCAIRKPLFFSSKPSSDVRCSIIHEK